ncbi:methyltransferase domain-containing protein [Patescibacteria group bacterium]|nr:methyltransferase domain-containing protein [Candidatus Falkowbacteria bacterium]MBU3905856.1 methyltransferase domain-containing protein [Patescibacteria group bacterium]MBU4015260.1 methyltransferase domain-containing protein [Patescibacteria group bacterium]MBU4027197.1 methyltransferase domain-containing protein [Patescibacteria group bacterium]MBU4073376.1 methyltransferase domain-containing protein [Patescibacteria group bacterium]
MSIFTEEKIKEWGQLSLARSESRDEYYGGPKSGKGIFKLYKYFFKKAIYNKQEPKILVLGATPELRDLVLGRNIPLMSVDQNARVADKMTGLMKYKNHPKETIVIGNWLDLPLPDNSIDFVMGDGISNNIAFLEHEELFLELQRILKSDGYILLRDIMLDKNHPRRIIKEIISSYKNEGWHKFDLFFELYLYSADGVYTPEDNVVSMDKLAQKLEKDVYGKNILTGPEEQWLKKFVKGLVKTTVVPEKRWLENFEKYFNVIDIAAASDYKFCEYFKFYFGKKL